MTCTNAGSIVDFLHHMGRIDGDQDHLTLVHHFLNRFEILLIGIVLTGNIRKLQGVAGVLFTDAHLILKGLGIITGRLVRTENLTAREYRIYEVVV